jgi:hypothetical protein
MTVLLNFGVEIFCSDSAGKRENHSDALDALLGPNELASER